MVKNYQYKLILITIVLLAYWPISSGVYMFANDMLDCWLPWRSFISENIKQGNIPLWNPYQACGYPIYADLQGPLWSPESFISGFIFDYQVNAVNILFLIYLIIGGLGIYDAVNYFAKSKTSAFIIAIAFALSGFFYSHSQHFYAIISGAWFPYLFLYVYRFIFEQNMRHGIISAVLFFMCTTSGNPTFTIISLYIFITIYIFRLSQVWKDKPVLKKMLRQLAITSLITIMLNAVLIVATYQCFDSISRNHGLSLEKASYNSFTLKSAISYILPVFSNTYDNWFGNDPTMRDYHLGVIILLIGISMIYAIKKDAQDKLFLGIAAVCALISLGKDFYVFQLFYYALPGLKLFRFPSYYIYFSNFFFLLFIGKYLEKWVIQVARKKIAHLFTSMFFFGLIVLFLVYYLNKKQINIDIHLLSNPIKFLSHINFHEALLINCFIIILVALTGFLLAKKTEISIKKITAIIVAIEMVILVSTSIGLTSLSECKRSDFIASLPSPSPNQNHNYIIGEIKDNPSGIACSWRNTNIYKHQVSSEYFNSFELDTFVKMSILAKDTFQRLLQHPLIYVMEAADSNSRIFDIRIAANEISAKTNIKDTCSAIILQNYSPYWKLYIDDKPTVVKSHFCFMKIELPINSKKLHLTFENKPIYVAFYLSYSVFILLLIYICYTYFTGNKLFN